MKGRNVAKKMVKTYGLIHIALAVKSVKRAFELPAPRAEAREMKMSILRGRSHAV